MAKRIGELQIILMPDGRADMHVDLPPGPDCDRAQRLLIAVSSLLGIDQEDITDESGDGGLATAVPEAQRGKVKN